MSGCNCRYNGNAQLVPSSNCKCFDKFKVGNFTARTGHFWCLVCEKHIVVGLGLSVLAASSFFSVPRSASVCEAAAMLGRASSEN